MTINYTTLLGLTEPVTGTQSGTWGSDINTGLTDYVEAAIAGAQVISGSQTAVTLSVTTGSSSAPTTLSQAGSGATGSSQYQIIRCTGNPASTLVIDVPKQDKTYIVINATSTSQTVTLRGGPSTPTTGVNIVAGEKAVCAWNGSDFVKVGGAAGGTNTQVQYNNNGVFGGVSGATTNGTAITFSTTNLKLQGSSTGVSSFASANSSATDYTVTFPAASTTIPVATQTLTFSGPTAARTITLPDANFTAARTDAAQTFTGVQTFSSNPILSGGTANGVLYLNGSSVATSGSALTFDGAKLNNSSGSAAGIIQSTDTAGSGNFVRILADASVGSLINFSTGSSLRFATSADNFSSFSEQMRLTSTGLGIGLGGGSPARKLQVNSGEAVAARFTRGGGIVANNSLEWFDGTNGWYAGVSGSNFWGVAYNSSGAIDTAAIRLDSSGNLGLGVTPSAWGSGSKAMELPSGVALSSFVGYSIVYNNAYHNGSSYIYKANGTATSYQTGGGTHLWFTATSGTAGNAITFTQAMTLDASGNLLVGGTVNTSIATVQVSVGSTSTGSSALQFLSTTSGSNGIYFGDGTSGTDRYRGYLEYNHASDFMALATAATERARITSGGDFFVKGAGTAGSTDAFQVSGSAPANAARITSGGDLLVGTITTTSGARLDVKGVDSTSSNYCMVFENSSNSLLLAVQNDGRWRSGTATASPYNYVVGATNRALYVDNGGNIGYVSSVRSSKTNIAPVSNADWLLQLNPVTFNFRKKDADGNYTEEADGPLKHGLIAEEVETINPDMCFYDDTEHGGALRGVNYSSLITPMLKLLQKQQALITSLTARVAALEGTQP